MRGGGAERRKKGPVDLFWPRKPEHACEGRVSMQQTFYAATRRLGAKLIAPEPQGLLGRKALAAPAPVGRFGRDQICFGQI